MHPLALILYHKQATSARLRFARFGDSMLAARLDLATDAAPHPGALLGAAADRLGLPVGELRIDPEFHGRLLAANGSASVWLGELLATDPPFAAVEAAGGRFVLLTELHGIPTPERDLMRAVYEHVLG